MPLFRTALIALAALTAGAALAAPPDPPEPGGTAVMPGGELVLLEIADDPLERYTGLRGRDHLPDDRGMLFLFHADEQHHLSGARFISTTAASATATSATVVPAAFVVHSQRETNHQKDYDCQDSKTTELGFGDERDGPHETA